MVFAFVTGELVFLKFRMECHQVAEGLYEQYKPWFTLWCGLSVGLIQDPGSNVAEDTQPVALVEVRP